MPKKIPTQLKQWHAEVAAVKKAAKQKGKKITHGEALKIASDLRSGKSGKSGKKKRGGNVFDDIVGTVGKLAPLASLLL